MRSPRSRARSGSRELRDLHSDDPTPVPEILAGTHGELRGYPIYDLAGVRSWSRGRVVAVGDAVHATSPSSGQGASLALEDAITLARCLRDCPTAATAFAEYQAVRAPRAEAVVRYARADRLAEAGDQEPARHRDPRRDDAAVPQERGG